MPREKNYIYNLEINADLVTLSACETGLGQLATGEGIVGLTRAFFYAGSKSLMVSFYDKVLLGTSKDQALTMAKRELLGTERYKQPYYWAPFILIGK